MYPYRSPCPPCSLEIIKPKKKRSVIKTFWFRFLIFLNTETCSSAWCGYRGTRHYRGLVNDPLCLRCYEAYKRGEIKYD